MSANFEAKKQIVAEIKDKLSRAKSVTFVDYRGLTVEQDTKMRKEFRENGAEYKVYKNRLMLLALNELGITGAVVFGYDDEVTQAKIVCDYVDKTKKLSIKFGLLNGQSVESKDIEALAKLPTKDVLVAKLLGTLLGPISSLARVLNAPTQGLAIALNAIAEKQ